MLAPRPGVIGMLSGMLVLLDDQSPWCKLTEVALLDRLGCRERVPIQQIPAALGVENAERDGLGPVGGGGAELNVVRVGDLPEVAGIGHWRGERDGLPRIPVASQFGSSGTVVRGRNRKQAEVGRYAGDACPAKDVEDGVRVRLRFAWHAAPFKGGRRLSLRLLGAVGLRG